MDERSQIPIGKWSVYIPPGDPLYPAQAAVSSENVRGVFQTDLLLSIHTFKTLTRS
jgi:hypothetical protein